MEPVSVLGGPVIDLTYPLQPAMPYWPGDGYQPFRFELMNSLDTQGVAAGRFAMPEHMGTHIDAPSHFIGNSTSVDGIPLEQLLHPLVRRRTDAWLEEVEVPVAAVEIPLLYETGGERRFDKVVVVTAPPGVRRSRSTAAGGSREARLMPDPEKAARADDVYENAGSLEELEEFVAAVLADLA